MNMTVFFTVYYIIFCTLIGIVLGSFLNVVIYRLPVGRTISRGRSMCMTCGHTLAAKDLVPLFSWLFLKGKCRYCGSPIASRYAKIEALTGFAFLTIALGNIRLITGILEFIDSERNLLLLLGISLYMIVMCCVISAMMIWHDTAKGMPHPATVALIFALGSVLICSTAQISRGLIFFIICIVALPILDFIGFMVRKKKYSRDDLFLDLTLACQVCAGGTSVFSTYLHPVFICITLLGTSLVRIFLRGNSKDKYAGIISFCINLLMLIISCVINLISNN